MPFRIKNPFSSNNEEATRLPSGIRNPFKSKNRKVTASTAPAATLSAANESLPYGLCILAEGVDPVLDIVAVHGLDGHREKSWTTNDVNWIRDLLPTDIPHARIMSWGYDARTHSLSRISGKYIYDHGKALISDLCVRRTLTKTTRRPIIFVAHSLGGIVLKSALIHSEAARKGALEEHRAIKLSTYGIIFMGTPHQGAAGVQLGELVLRIASVFIPTDNRVLRHIDQDSEWLHQQLQQYAPISQSFVTKFAYETIPTTLIAFGKKIMIVPRASAVVPGTTEGGQIAIPADHINIIKFASRQDVGYEKVSEELQVMAKNSSTVIRAHWDEQDRINNVLANVTDDFSMPFSLYGVPEIEDFVGRKAELSKMEEAFQNDGSERTVVVLHGLGGMGKTQLAIKYLKEHRKTYSAVFWLNGKTEDTLKQSFLDIARRLHSEHEDSSLLNRATESKDIDEIVVIIRKWLSLRNIDNPKVAENQDPQAYDIRSYFPDAHHGSIIITTRSSGLRIGKVVPVRKFQDTKEAIAILNSNSGRENLDRDPDAAKLAVKLDGLPLALATAGAYLGQVSMSLEKYIHYYEESWLKLQKTSPGLLSYEDRTLYTTWNLSYEHIQTQNEKAARLLRLWAYFDNQDLWYELLASGKNSGPVWFSDIAQDELSSNQVIRLLCDHGLVEPIEGPSDHLKGYGMHSCVHHWTKYVLFDEGDVEMGRILLHCVGTSAPKGEVLEYWRPQRRLLPHASKFIDVVQNDSDGSLEYYPEIFDDISSLGSLFEDQGKFKEAEVMYQKALGGQDKALGLEHISTLDTVHRLGDVYGTKGEFDKAEAMYERALKGREKSLGLEHPSTLHTVNNLGVLYRDQSKLKEAEAMYQRALDGRERSLGLEHPSTLDTVNNLGILYWGQGNLKEAEALSQRALDGREKSLGLEHPITLATVNNLGLLYWNQGKLKEAEAMYQRALDGKEKSLGLEHPSTIDTVNNLGVLYWNQGRSKEADAMYQRALDGREKSLGLEHPSTLDTVHNLGVLYRDQGKLKEAEAIYQRALDGRAKSLGLEHPSTLDTVNNLGVLYWDQGRLKESEVMHQRVLEGREKSLGPEHPSTLDTVNNLGILYKDQGKLEKAEALYNRALVGKEMLLGPEHPSTLTAVNNLGEVYKIQGRLKEAEALLQRALDGKEKALGLAHIDTLYTVLNFGDLYAHQGKYEEAETFLRRAVEGYERVVVPEHVDFIKAVNQLRDLYRKQGKTEEADVLLLRVGKNESGQLPSS